MHNVALHSRLLPELITILHFLAVQHFPVSEMLFTYLSQEQSSQNCVVSKYTSTTYICLCIVYKSQYTHNNNIHQAKYENGGPKRKTLFQYACTTYIVQYIHCTDGSITQYGYKKHINTNK